MAYGGSKVGNNDPEAIIANSTPAPELEPKELVRYSRKHSGDIGGLVLTLGLVDPQNPQEVSSFFDELQSPSTTGKARIIRILEILSDNAAIYDEEIEGVIEQDPLIIALLQKRSDPQSTRRIRLRRSLVAIAQLQSLASSSGSETR